MKEERGEEKEKDEFALISKPRSQLVSRVELSDNYFYIYKLN